MIYRHPHPALAPLRMALGAALIGLASLGALGRPAMAQSLYPVTQTEVTDWKSVYGTVENRRQIPARLRLNGTLVSLNVAEGDLVAAGDVLGRVENIGLGFQLEASAAQLDALRSQLDNANTELARGEELLSRGVTTAQRLDALRTQVEVLQNQIAATEAQARVIAQQISEGDVLAPIAGQVLAVPAAAGAVMMAGESLAVIGGEGVFLRLSIPERHAALLAEGDAIDITAGQSQSQGRLERIYPLIENGRVTADISVEGLDGTFVGQRVLVRLPIGERMAIMVPEAALTARFGLDYLRVQSPDGPLERAVQIGARHQIDGQGMVEILSGLGAGDSVVLP